MKKGVTLIEVIMTISIAGILMVGTSELLNSMAQSSQRAKTLTNLSLDTQTALSQISSLLYYRVPNSVIGYDGVLNFEPIENLTNNNKKILEWFGVPKEAIFQKMSASNDIMLSNFIDMAASDFSTKTLISPLSNFTKVSNIIGKKFSGKSIQDSAIFFAGSFDSGDGNINNFGWHGSLSTNIYKVANSSSGTSLKISGTNQPEYIYEKFYLADTAYAVARGEDITTSATCISNLKIPNTQINNSLILFYNFRPWNGETFCADKGSKGKKSGDATLISLNIQGIKASYENFTLRVSLDAKKDIKGSSNNVHVTKQKVIF